MALNGEYPSPFLELFAAGNNEVKRGDAILISMENYASRRKHRPGAAVDLERLKILFKSLSFNVDPYVDKKANDLKSMLKNVSKTKSEETADCFVCYVSAHGNTDNHGHYIEAIDDDESDNRVYIYDDILKPFLTSDALKGIPKVFLIDCCRGEYSKPKVRSAESVVDYMKTGPDTLVVFSTEEGNESLRDTKLGTLFVQAFCEVIPLKREIEDVRAMVAMANKMLIKNSEAHFKAVHRRNCKDEKKKPNCQVPQIHFNLTGKLFWRSYPRSKTSADQIKKADNSIVGQDDLREKLKKWLTETKGKSAAGGVESQSFVVSGMGGIGKTTLAKSLSEDSEIKYYFDHRVYWVSVKKDPDIVKCQRLLISEICKATPSMEVDNPTLLLEELKDKLSRMRRIFLILDDVWETEDVENFLGDPFLDTLPPGSKCIITSRKPAELEKLDANIQVEKLDVLNEVDAKKLFCNKAFLNGILPKKMNKSLVDEVIDACGRMPILLAAIGADRWGIESTESWEEVRDQLQNIAAEKYKTDDESAKSDKLIKQLKISYDDLPEWDSNSSHVINYKDCFLDFAAFGKREEIEISVLMDLWTKPGFTEDETYGILEELEQRCLVKMDGYTCRVHDIFRTLAVNIIEEQPVKKRKRLFAWGLNNSRLPDEWEISQNVGTGDETPKVVMFDTEKMVIAKSELKEFHPKDAILFTCLTGLRMLFLTSNLNLVKLPSAIKHMTSLEKLDLSWCLGLERLPREIGQLESLKKLNTAGCCSLTEIPAEVGNLKKLVELNMQSCGIPKLPDEIGELKKLIYLCLNDCNKLESLPSAMGKLSSLERLECEMLPIKEIPKALGNLSKLKHLSFATCCLITEIPVEFMKLESAISFCFASCFELEIVPVELDQLVTKGSLAVFDVSDTRMKSQNLPPSLLELQERSKHHISFQDANGKRETEGKSRYMRGVLVDPTSVFHPNSKEERRSSFGLARIISMVKTEPFLSPRFDLAIRLMRTMANHDGTRHAIVRSGGLPVILRCIDKGDPERCGIHAGATLRNICRPYSTHKAVFDAGALSILTRVLHRKNDIRFIAYQALRQIMNGDIEERDYAFTTEINELCGHDFRNCDSKCIFCKVELEFDGNPDVKRRLRR